jgi:hypothetical protein
MSLGVDSGVGVVQSLGMRSTRSMIDLGIRLDRVRSADDRRCGLELAFEGALEEGVEEVFGLACC